MNFQEFPGIPSLLCKRMQFGTYMGKVGNSQEFLGIPPKLEMTFSQGHEAFNRFVSFKVLQPLF